jgi:hypothetical protein
MILAFIITIPQLCKARLNIFDLLETNAIEQQCKEGCNLGDNLVG